MKKPYAQITYRNCSVDYSYTICELSDINDNIEVFKTDNEDLSESDFKVSNSPDFLPQIILTIIMLTDEEYLEWFTEHIESRA